MTETDRAGPATSPPGIRRERGDENFRTILLTAAILVGTCVAVLLAMVWMLDYFQHREEVDKRGTFPLATQENQEPLDQRLKQLSDSAPLLEGLQGPAHLSQLAEQQRLQEFGPSPEKGFARIPIELAMQRMLEKHRFPVQSAPEPKPPKKEERP